MRYITILLAIVVCLAAFSSPRSGSAKPAPRLTIEPDRIKLRLGEGKQLKAELKGAEGGVRWEVEGAGAGSITASGYYQAPSQAATPATFRIRVTAEGNPELKAEARVFLEAVSVEVQPAMVALASGETYQFRARINGTRDQRVNWSVEGGSTHGQITDGGLFTAPTRFPTPGTILVRAHSQADPSRSAVATIRIGEVSIKAEPREVTLQHGQSRRFEARVEGTGNTAVEWSVVGAGLGKVSNSGLYTFPPSMSTPAVVTVLAKSVADPSKTATVRIRVPEVVVGEKGGKGKQSQRRSTLHRMARRIYSFAAPRVVRILIPFDPVDMVVRGPNFKGKSGKQYVPLGGAVALNGTVYNTTNPELRWEQLGDKVGELTPDGVYRAPETLATPYVLQVRAASEADPSKTALYTLHIPPVVVQAEREIVPCTLDGAAQLAARVENAENDRILWSVEGGEKYGTVSESGLYHPPGALSTPAVVRVRAASQADPTKFVVVQVNIPEVSLDISPEREELRPGRTVRFKTRVNGGSGPVGEVTWKLTPEAGSISPDGVYQAPENGGAMVVQVTATLKADPTKTAVATVRLTGK